MSASVAKGSVNQCCKLTKLRKIDMTDKKPSKSREEASDNRSDAEKYLERAEKLHAERVEFGKELDQRIADLVATSERTITELGKQIEELAAEDRKHHAEIKEMQAENAKQQDKNAKQIERMLAESENRNKEVGGLSNKFGRFTEELAEPSIREILDEGFDADFRPELKSKVSNRLVAHLVDAWGVARNGVRAVYLIEVKSRFRPGKHFKQIWEQVEDFRTYAPEYADYQIYPMVGVVDASEQDRLQIWRNGMYVIDVADGVFKLAQRPDGFKPNGSHGMQEKGGGTPNLRMVPGGLTGAKWSQHSS